MAASEPRPVLLQKVHYGLPQVKLGPNRDLRRHTHTALPYPSHLSIQQVKRDCRNKLMFAFLGFLVGINRDVSVLATASMAYTPLQCSLVSMMFVRVGIQS